MPLLTTVDVAILADLIILQMLTSIICLNQLTVCSCSVVMSAKMENTLSEIIEWVDVVELAWQLIAVNCTFC